MSALPWLLGAAAAVALIATSSGPSSAQPEGIDDGRPILVLGDSYAVGIAAALRSLYPGRDVRSLAAVGATSNATQPATDAPLFTILSVGTNDAGSVSRELEPIASSILRVLGPYAAHTAREGALFYLLPHANMADSALADRVKALRALLLPRLSSWSRFRFGEPQIAPSDPARVHFDAAGYRSIAQQAMHALAPGGLQLEPPTGGSKSGLLAGGAIDPAFLARSRQIAQRTGIPLDYLLAIMWFETGGTLRSDIENGAGSGATGLIQFMPAYRGKPVLYQGKTVAQLAQMSAVDQLAYVEGHFARFGSFAGRPPSDAYLAVFSPDMLGRADDYPYYLEAGGEHGPGSTYAANKGVDLNHDGAITVGEVRRVILPSLAQIRAKGWL